MFLSYQLSKRLSSRFPKISEKFQEGFLLMRLPFPYSLNFSTISVACQVDDSWTLLAQRPASPGLASSDASLQRSRGENLRNAVRSRCMPLWRSNAPACATERPEGNSKQSEATRGGVSIAVVVVSLSSLIP